MYFAYLISKHLLFYLSHFYSCFFLPVSLSCQNYKLFTGKWQQSLKAWIQLLVCKATGLGSALQSGSSQRGGKRWADGVSQRPGSSGRTLGLHGVRGRTLGRESRGGDLKNWLWGIVESSSELLQRRPPPPFAGGVVRSVLPRWVDTT